MRLITFIARVDAPLWLVPFVITVITVITVINMIQNTIHHGRRGWWVLRGTRGCEGGILDYVYIPHQVRGEREGSPGVRGGWLEL